jgi:hypothetical protein
MAKRVKKAPKKGIDSDEAQSQGYKMIGAGKLKKLMAAAREGYQSARDIAESLGAEIKGAVDNDNLHRKAFSAVRAEDRMEPEKLAEYFAHRDLYEEILGLRKRAASAPRLPLDGDKDEAGEPDADAPKDAPRENVRPFPRQQSVAEA